MLTRKVYDRSSGSDVLKFTKTLLWNADGTAASATEGSDTLSYVSDAAGRPSQLKRGSTVLTAWTYTPAIGTLATRTDGTMGTTTFSYDWAKRQTGITPPASYTTGTITRTYRLDGTLATQAFPSSLTETLVYDPAKRPVSISLGSAGSLSQTYSRAGRVSSDSRSLSGITGDAGGGTQSFTYDGLGRLVGSTGLTSGARSYTYDLDANRLTRLESAVTTTFSYDRTDELVNQVIGGTTKTFVSDAFGNQTTAADANSLLTTYAYDEANRLTTITPPSGSPATFTVDALDRPKTRTVGAAVDTYGYLGASKTSYETGAGSTDALLDASGARLAVKTGSTVSFALFDLHGSLVGLCTAGGSTISDAYRYDAFGQTLVASGSAVNPWRYRGLLDVSPTTTPLYAMGARFYSPMLGTFTSEDSIAGKAADPLSMNRYLYAEADPTTLIDPDGHAVLCSPLVDLCTQGGVLSSYTAATSTVTKPTYCQRYPAECARQGARYPTYTPTCSSSICQAGRPAQVGWPGMQCNRGGRLGSRCYVPNPELDAFGHGLFDGFLTGAAISLLAVGCIVVTAGGCAIFVLGAATLGTSYAVTMAINDHGVELAPGVHLGGDRPWSSYEIGNWTGGIASSLLVGGAYVGGEGPAGFSGVGRSGGAAITNEVPADLTFARALRREQVAELESGGNPTLSVHSGQDRAFITSSGSLPSGLSRAELATLLTIPESNVGAILRFRLADPSGLASPIRASAPGFVGGGLTAGGLPEFVIPNQPILNFDFWMLEYPNG